MVTARRRELCGIEINGGISHKAACTIHNVAEIVGAREIPVEALDAPNDKDDDGNDLSYLDEAAFALFVELFFLLGAEAPRYAAQGIPANAPSTRHVVVVGATILLLFGNHLLEERHRLIVHVPIGGG